MTSVEAQNLTQSIYDGIFGSLTGSPDGKAGAYDPNKTFLTLQKPGVLINPTDFANVWNPGNPNGSMQNAGNLYDLVNQVPNFSAYQTNSGKLVSDIYNQVLEATVTVVDPPPSAAEQQQINAANALLFTNALDENGNPTTVQSAISIAYDTNEATYVNAKVAYQQAYQAAMATPATKAQWPILAPSQLLPVNQAWDAWQTGGAAKVEAARAVLETSGGNQVQRAFADAQKLYAGYQVTLDDSGQMVERSAVAPSNWYMATSGLKWPTVKWTQATSTLNQHSDFTSYGGGGGFSLGFWSVGGSAQHTSSSFHSDATLTKIAVSYSYLVVTIRRPWQTALLYSLPGWKTDIAKKGGISTGSKNGQSNSLCPMIPMAFIVVKDVVITGDFSQSEVNQASSSISAGASVGWGPFSVSGNYSHSDSSLSVKGSVTTSKITAPGMQILGWINQILPMCPPE
jgi:hypothetical protein